MEKFILSKEHLEKRRQKKRFVLRDDIMGTFLQRIMSIQDYFDFSFQFPDEADKILVDGMGGGGEWMSVYDSEIVPRYKIDYYDRFSDAGIDLFGEWVSYVHKKNKECWVTHRVGDIHSDKVFPIEATKEHPEWFFEITGGYKINNIAIPEIQERKIRIFGEWMRKFSFDGLDIDFERHTPILPPGKQWEMREYITDFMRKVRKELLEIGKEQGRVIMLSARVPDCLKGCHEDGLDIEQWVKEGLIDCLTLGSRSFDVKAEEFRALSDEIQIYCCYDPHHTVDGYTFPPIETLRGVWYSHLTRGADGIEYFNWTGEGKKELVDKYVKKYKTDPMRDNFVQYSKDDFTGINDKEFLARQDKTYVIDRKGGYPWGIGYGNMNADRQLPCDVINGKEFKLYVAENVALAKKATLKLLFEETSEIPEISLNGEKLSFTFKPHRDLQITTEKEAPISGYTITLRILKNEDYSKPCVMFTADITGKQTKIGYNSVYVSAAKPVRAEKIELEIKK